MDNAAQMPKSFGGIPAGDERQILEKKTEERAQLSN